MPEERKLVSILFADVTGSTALGETLDAEDVRALMRRYYEHAQRIIPSYGGTLEKFIGDAVMSVFGLSQAHDDDAERALAAALALRDAVAHRGQYRQGCGDQRYFSRRFSGDRRCGERECSAATGCRSGRDPGERTYCHCCQEGISLR